MTQSRDHGRAHSARPAHCLASGRGTPSAPGQGRYSRLFPQLAPLEVEEAPLVAMGQPGGPCEQSGVVATSKATSAGWPFFGQLIAHDITADRSVVTHQASVALTNARQARLDLECLYAGGPSGTVYMYDARQYQKFLTAANGSDVPRNAQGIAIIGDARNDSHFFMNRLHLALMRGHNTLVDRLAAMGVAEDDLFLRARTALTWFYQWVIVNEYLPMLVGRSLVDDLLTGAVQLPGRQPASLPLEFADAAFRYGHAQIRQAYRLVPHGPELSIFPDLLGFGPVPADRKIDFAILFDRPGQSVALRAMPLTERMPPALITLPTEITGTLVDTRYASLAARDLRRGLSTALPSGEAVASALGLAPLDRDTLGPSPAAAGTPLLTYILREAQLIGGGEVLGPVGGRLVAGVLIGLLRDDPGSYLSVNDRWHPSRQPELRVEEGACLLDLLNLSKTHAPEENDGPFL